jgi:hypothetical protein
MPYPIAEDETLSLREAQRLGQERRKAIALRLLEFYCYELQPDQVAGHFALLAEVFGIRHKVEEFARSNCNTPQLEQELLLVLALECLRRVV